MPEPSFMFHSFATEGFVPWAELYLEGIRRSYGRKVHVRLDGWGLTNEQIDMLYDIHPNVTIVNRPADYQLIADRVGVDIETIYKWKKKIEYGTTNSKNFYFKLFISVDQRYRGLADIVAYARAHGFTYLIHSDVDTYLRKPLDPLFAALSQYDFAVPLRPSQAEHRKVLGTFLGFNLSERLDPFLARWMGGIDETPLLDRWQGFGQTVLWRALQASPELNVLDIFIHPDAPRLSKTFERNASVWLGSNAKVRGSNIQVARRKCWQDFRQRLPRIPT